MINDRVCTISTLTVLKYSRHLPTILEMVTIMGITVSCNPIVYIICQSHSVIGSFVCNSLTTTADQRTAYSRLPYRIQQTANSGTINIPNLSVVRFGGWVCYTDSLDTLHYLSSYSNTNTVYCTVATTRHRVMKYPIPITRS